MLKVVVVDGNAISRQLLTTVLVNGGHAVVGDASPTSAGLAHVIKLHPQIVCIDIGQADDEALGKIDTLRAALPKALIFMVSGQFDQAALQSGLGRGVQGFIVKPFNGVTVLETIRKAIIKLARQHKASSAS